MGVNERKDLDKEELENIAYTIHLRKITLIQNMLH